MLEEIVAQIEFNFTRDPDHDPARQELEDALGQRDRNERQRINKQLVPRDAAVQSIDCALYDLRKQYPDAVMKQHRARAQDVSPLVFAEVWRERSQGLEHELKDDFISGADSAEFENAESRELWRSRAKENPGLRPRASRETLNLSS